MSLAPERRLGGRYVTAPPRRPALRWHGGKWLLAPWIISNLPPHRIYVEPFGGAASVLLRKPKVYGEVYNDLDEEVVRFFRVLRDPAAAAELVRRLELTPYARVEFDWSMETAERDDVEAARALVVRSFMGFGSNAHASSRRGHRSTGFRANSSRSGTTPAHDWANYPENLRAIAERFRDVVVESRAALEVITQQDGVDTLFYCDPPYVHATRSAGAVDHMDVKYRMYRHEMADGEHAALLEQLRGVVGMVALSGYATDLYDRALPDWRRIEKETHADGARDRTEVLWLNPQACAASAQGVLW